LEAAHESDQTYATAAHLWQSKSNNAMISCFFSQFKRKSMECEIWSTRDVRRRRLEGHEMWDFQGTFPDCDQSSVPIPLTGLLRRKQTEFGDCRAEKSPTFQFVRSLEFYDGLGTVKMTLSQEEGDFKLLCDGH
jgi:hypothetical protein